MPRKILLELSGTPGQLLVETLAESELQLQDMIRSNPDLLPIEEFGLSGPALVIGRETVLPSGAVDLVLLARSGDIVIAEFKTGPQNPDFRAALGQLIDYGSDMWGMSYEEFEQTLAVRYFMSDRCTEPKTRRKSSLVEAMADVWADSSDEEASAIRDSIAQRLVSGAFHYVVAAQRFTVTMERSLQYLNVTMPSCRFHAVEVVRFKSANVSAFETRSLLRGMQTSAANVPRGAVDVLFFESLESDEYRHALENLFEVCRGLGLRFEWQSLGTSIRIRTPDRTEPLSIGWAFPPGKSGWYGLRHLTLGYDPASAAGRPSMRSVLDWYTTELQRLPGVQAPQSSKIQGVNLVPQVTIQLQGRLEEVLAELVRRANDGDTVSG
jgi:hypothetical protein